MATISPPNTFGQIQAEAGLPYVYAAAQIELALMDLLDPIILGLAQLKGDLAGSRSDVLRITYADNIGYARAMTAAASETDPVTASPWDLGYSTITIGEYLLSHEETFRNQVLNGQPGIGLDDLISLVPRSWIATVRELVANAGAGITTAIGTNATTLSVDNVLSARAAARAADAYGPLIGMLAPQQLDQLIQSMRSEPNLISGSTDFAAVAGPATDMPVITNVLGQNISFGISNNVDQASSAYQGFVVSPGGIGYAVASTGGIKQRTPESVYVPEMGMFIEHLTDTRRQRIDAYQAVSYLGVALGSSEVYFQRRLISQV